MRTKSDIASEIVMTRRISDSMVISEYTAGKNKFANIVVDRCTKSIAKIYPELFKYLVENKLAIVSQFLFGTEKHEFENNKNAEKYFQVLSWPVTAIRQNGSKNSSAWSSIFLTVSGINLKQVVRDDLVIGNYFEDDFGVYYTLGGLSPYNDSHSRLQQAEHSFYILESLLDKPGMNIFNVVRTWFYLSDLLEWYDDFNSARNQYFTNKGIFKKLIPASTGIGAGNLRNCSLICGGYAVKNKLNNIVIESVNSPYQCPASDYKSSFSRAVEIKHPDYHQLIVSGTASIKPDGETANVGDVVKQVELTMKVVYGILQSRQMSWKNIVRGIVYFKYESDFETFNQFCTKNEIPLLPVSIIQADICRDELLFEIEVDAVKIK